jgi:hypothetical protein
MSCVAAPTAGHTRMELTPWRILKGFVGARSQRECECPRSRSPPEVSTRRSAPGFSTRGSPPEADTSSDSYKAGLDSGTKGLAEIEAFKGADYNDICEQSFELDNALDLYNKPDYMPGCLYGLSHQSAQWTQTRK